MAVIYARKENMFTITEEVLRELWGNGKTISINKMKMCVHKMSYGEYFLEPSNWKGGETDGFAPDTQWLKLIDSKKRIYAIV